jgi:hypothetical protein
MPFCNRTGTPRTSVAYIAQAVGYYLLYGILFPIAHIFNRSFLLQHPGYVLPTFLAPDRNREVRTFRVSPPEVNRIKNEFNRAVLTEQEWFPPYEVPDQALGCRELIRVLTLERGPHGELQLPDGRLAQGTGIVQRGIFLLIWDEVGRWPTRPDHIATHTYSWNFNGFLALFLPISSLIKIGDAQAPWVEQEWEDPTSVWEMMEWQRKNQAPYSQA